MSRQIIPISEMSLTELIVLKSELESFGDDDEDMWLDKVQTEIDLRISEYINYDK